MGYQQLYWSHPQKFSQGSCSCHICSNQHSLIWKYGLNIYHQPFQQYTKDICFIKLD
ncbi:40S ribosomal protein S29-like [Piliocolobus tephrosceles]|uniref:40S ribosomal protein S29-like n=1 Tax=Piliocolobus tephrosceles TaxID=591936 RepID=UPI000E6B2DCD|nr:40S ribosomal protein S29-like [Piliocolobus tephrosceles]